MLRSEAAADESLAAIRARIRFGIAIAAMIRMIATTISSSISEKPFCFRISFFPSYLSSLDVWVTDDAVGMIIALAGPKQIVTLGSSPLRKPALFSAESYTFVPILQLSGAFVVAKCVSRADNSCQSARDTVTFQNAFLSSTCTIFPCHHSPLLLIASSPGHAPQIAL